MKKLVINICYGGFGVSDKVSKKYPTLNRNTERDDPLLIKAVEEFGGEASGRFAKLAIIEIPDDVDWMIEEYDGREWVAERHRIWESEEE